jgi:hypothetical protein
VRCGAIEGINNIVSSYVITKIHEKVKCKSLKELLLSINHLGTQDLLDGMTLKCPKLDIIDVDNIDKEEKDE